MYRQGVLDGLPVLEALVSASSRHQDFADAGALKSDSAAPANLPAVLGVRSTTRISRKASRIKAATVEVTAVN